MSQSQLVNRSAIPAQVSLDLKYFCGPQSLFDVSQLFAGDWVFSGFFPSRKTFGGDFGTGTLTALPENFYLGEVPMIVTSGGTGQTDLDLLLDENSFPQPVSGTLTAPSP